MLCVQGHHCIGMGSAFAVSSYLFGLAALVAVRQARQRRALTTRLHFGAGRRLPCFTPLLAVSFTLRALWCVLTALHTGEDWDAGAGGGAGAWDAPCAGWRDCRHIGVTIFNRLATLAYFSAFSLVLSFWMEVADGAAGEEAGVERPLLQKAGGGGGGGGISAGLAGSGDSAQTNRHQVMLMIVNIWMYVVLFGITVAKPLCGKAWQARLHAVDMWQTAAFFALLTVATLSYGYQLRAQLAPVKIHVHGVAAAVERKLLAIVCVCGALFALKSACFAWGQVGSLPEWSHPWLFYTVPEVVPGLLLLALMSVNQGTLRSEELQRKREIRERAAAATAAAGGGGSGGGFSGSLRRSKMDITVGMPLDAMLMTVGGNPYMGYQSDDECAAPSTEFAL